MPHPTLIHTALGWMVAELDHGTYKTIPGGFRVYPEMVDDTAELPPEPVVKELAA
jgi:hypothetical protein